MCLFIKLYAVCKITNMKCVGRMGQTCFLFFIFFGPFLVGGGWIEDAFFFKFCLLFLSDPGVPGVRSMGPVVCNKLSDLFET